MILSLFSQASATAIAAIFHGVQHFRQPKFAPGVEDAILGDHSRRAGVSCRSLKFRLRRDVCGGLYGNSQQGVRCRGAFPHIQPERLRSLEAGDRDEYDPKLRPTVSSPNLKQIDGVVLQAVVNKTAHELLILWRRGSPVHTSRSVCGTVMLKVFAVGFPSSDTVRLVHTTSVTWLSTWQPMNEVVAQVSPPWQLEDTRASPRAKLDEKRRRIHLQAAAISFRLTVILMFVFDGLKNAGIYRATLSDLETGTVLIWAAALIVLSLRYR
jgi:hypothetical protein